jgi:hypothetical protein
MSHPCCGGPHTAQERNPLGHAVDCENYGLGAGETFWPGVSHLSAAHQEALRPRPGDRVPGTKYSIYGVLDPAVQGAREALLRAKAKLDAHEPKSEAVPCPNCGWDLRMKGHPRSCDYYKQRPGDQQLPTVNDEPDIQSQVIADIEERRLVGIQRYGTALQPFNGRDAVRDLYEELIDGAMYAKQWLLERERLLEQVSALKDELAETEALLQHANENHCGCI